MSPHLTGLALDPQWPPLLSQPHSALAVRGAGTSSCRRYLAAGAPSPAAAAPAGTAATLSVTVTAATAAASASRRLPTAAASPSVDSRRRRGSTGADWALGGTAVPAGGASCPPRAAALQRSVCSYFGGGGRRGKTSNTGGPAIRSPACGLASGQSGRGRWPRFRRLPTARAAGRREGRVDRPRQPHTVPQ